jgi:hypothetical protein
MTELRLVTNLGPEFHDELLAALAMPCVRCDDVDSPHRVLVTGDDALLAPFCGECARECLSVDWLLPDRFAAALCTPAAADVVLFQLSLYEAHARGRVPLPHHNLRRPARWAQA